jgi:hypothetical protein
MTSVSAIAGAVAAEALLGVDLGQRRALGRFVEGGRLVLADGDNRVCVSLHLVRAVMFSSIAFPCLEPGAGGLLLGRG